MNKKNVLLFMVLVSFLLVNCRKDPYDNVDPQTIKVSPQPTPLPQTKDQKQKKSLKKSKTLVNKLKNKDLLPSSIIRAKIPALKNPTKILFGKRKKSLLLGHANDLRLGSGLGGSFGKRGLSFGTKGGLSLGSLSLNSGLSLGLDDKKKQVPSTQPQKQIPSTQPQKRVPSTQPSKTATSRFPKAQNAPKNLYPKDGILVKVNEEPLYLMDFLRAMQMRQKLLSMQNKSMPMGAALSLMRKKTLDMMIAERLLYQRAIQRGIGITRVEIARMRQRFLSNLRGMSEAQFIARMKLTKKQFNDKLKRQIVLQKFMKILALEISISPIELQRYYNKTIGSGEVQVRHIVLLLGESPSKAKKEKLLQKINKILTLVQASGADFAEIAKKYSEDGSSESGGDLGFLKKGESLKALDQHIFNMTVGEIKGPILSSIGYHIIKVVKRKKPRPFRQVQAKLTYQMRMLKLKDYLQKIAKQLRREGDIEIFVSWGKSADKK